MLNVNNREVAAEVNGQHQLVFLSFPKVESEQAYGHPFYVEDADTSTYFRLTCFVCEAFTLTSSTTTSSIVMNGSIGFSSPGEIFYKLSMFI